MSRLNKRLYCDKYMSIATRYTIIVNNFNVNLFVHFAIHNLIGILHWQRYIKILNIFKFNP